MSIVALPAIAAAALKSESAKNADEKKGAKRPFWFENKSTDTRYGRSPFSYLTALATAFLYGASFSGEGFSPSVPFGHSMT